MRTSTFATSIVCAMGLATAASADIARITATGTINQSAINAIDVGDDFTFVFDIDLDMSTDSSAHPSTGVYEGAVVDFSLAVGSYNIVGTGPGTPEISHYVGDVDGFNLDLNSTDNFSHEFLRTIRMELVHFGAMQFDSDDLDEVLNLGDISAWNEVRDFSVTGAGSQGAGGQISGISVEVIPAPSSIAMLGFATLAATRRRR